MNDYDLFSFNWTTEDYGHLDSGIRELVRGLHQFRIRTIWSCEGHIRSSGLYVGVLPYPWVIVILNPDDLARLQKKITEWNMRHPLERWMLSKERVHGSFTPEYIAAEVTGGNKSLTVTALVPEDDNERCLSPRLLNNFQQQVPRLAEFIAAWEA